VTKAVFIRLVNEDNKGHFMGHSVGELRRGKTGTHTFTVNPASFKRVPGSPFAYWTSERMRRLFDLWPPLECEGRTAKIGASTKDDFRWLRLCWEVSPRHILHGGNGPWRDAPRFVPWCSEQTFAGQRWVAFAKGGQWSPYFADIALVLDWREDGAEIKRAVSEYRASHGWSPHWKAELHNPNFYFRPGLTWSRRTQAGLTMRILPAGCIFADKGPALFDAREHLPSLLGLVNSAPFLHLVSLQMAFGSYEVGIVARTPIPSLSNKSADRAGELGLQCVQLRRSLDTGNESSHVFQLPSLLRVPGDTLEERMTARDREVQHIYVELAEKQRNIDDIAFNAYGFGDADRLAIEESGAQQNVELNSLAENDEPLAKPRLNLVAELLSYAVGCVFGRWDLQVASGVRSLPELPDPFAPLPAYSPGMLPIGTPPDDYPITVGPHGILVDDPDHPDDIVRGVRDVLAVLFKERVEGIETEACEVLGTKDLRSYFSNPRQFFNRHIQQYSKSRRKAPIYWLLQSPRGSYGLWLYYRRLNKDTLFKALTLYVEPKIRLEESRLEGLQVQRAGAAHGGKEVRQAEKVMERQEIILADLHDFHGRLKRAAELNLVPDLDDGVVLTMAPLWELSPWKEPKMYWEELLRGKYEWSSIGMQLREKGLVRS